MATIYMKRKALEPAPVIAPAQDRRVSTFSAGYMELEGAKKDAECEIVKVDDSISNELGCCNLYTPIEKADEFKCGECIYTKER